VAFEKRDAGRSLRASRLVFVGGMVGEGGEVAGEGD